jgi:hypothetical protein
LEAVALHPQMAQIHLDFLSQLLAVAVVDQALQETQAAPAVAVVAVKKVVRVVKVAAQQPLVKEIAAAVEAL